MKFQYRPISRSFGAEIVDFNASDIDDVEVHSELRHAFRKYRLLLFRNLDISAAQQERLSEIFGRTAPRPPVLEHMNPAEANMQYVSNTREDGMLPDGELTYHQDHLFDPTPLRAVMLYGMEVPNHGGETKFRSLDETYRQLDAGTRELAEKVRCLHLFDFDNPPLPGPNIEKRLYFTRETSPNAPRTWQPLVFRDPDGGDPAVWALYGETVEFDGVTFEEGQQLLSDILDVAAETDEYSHKWRVGDALIWDNLHLQHAREPFPSSDLRTLRRATLV